MKLGDTVVILSGKYAGYTGILDYLADPHPMSPSKPRWAVRYYGFGFGRTLLIQEKNLRAL